MKDRSLIMEQYLATGASGGSVIQMEVWLDMRDLLNTIRMTSNVEEWELIADEEEPEQ